MSTATVRRWYLPMDSEHDEKGRGAGQCGQTSGRDERQREGGPQSTDKLEWARFANYPSVARASVGSVRLQTEQKGMRAQRRDELAWLTNSTKPCWHYQTSAIESGTERTHGQRAARARWQCRTRRWFRTRRPRSARRAANQHAPNERVRESWR